MFFQNFKLFCKQKPVLSILMLSTFIQIFWISYEHAGFHCDSPAYLEFATTFWGSLPQQLTVWVRTAGYPILLAITGTFGLDGNFNSFWPIVILQSIMAILMPIFIFGALRPYNLKIAFFSAIIFIASLNPFLASKLIMTEQPFKFFALLQICIAFKIMATPKWKIYGNLSNKKLLNSWVIVFSIVTIFLMLMRPSAILNTCIIIGTLLIVKFYIWRHLLKSTLIIMFALTSASFYTSLYLPPVNKYEEPSKSYLSDLLFYDLYLNDNQVLSPNEGKRRNELKRILVDYYVRFHEIKKNIIKGGNTISFKDNTKQKLELKKLSQSEINLFQNKLKKAEQLILISNNTKQKDKKNKVLNEAILNLKQANKIKPHDAHTVILLVTYLIEQNKYDRAMFFVEETQKILINNSFLFHLKAKIFHKLNKYSLAISHINKAIKIKPLYIEFYFTKLNILKNLDNKPEIIKTTSQIINLSKEKQTLFRALKIRANTFEKLNDFQSAVEDLNKLLKLETSNNEIKKEREILVSKLHLSKMSILKANKFDNVKLKANAEAWYKQLLENPNSENFIIIKNILADNSSFSEFDETKLRKKSKKILLRVALEVYLSEPWRVFKFISRYAYIRTYGGGVPMAYNKILSEWKVASLHPSNGPNTQRFLTILKKQLKKYPMYEVQLNDPNQKITEEEYLNADKFINKVILGTPHPLAVYSTWTRIYRELGAVNGNKLYSDVIKEAIFAGSKDNAVKVLKRSFKYTSNQVLKFFFEPRLNFFFYHKIVYCHNDYKKELLQGMRVFTHNKIEPGKLIKEANVKLSDPIEKWYPNASSTLDYLVQTNWIISHLIGMILLILTIILSLFTKYRWHSVIIFGIVFSHAFASSLITPSYDRYIDQIIPIIFLNFGFFVLIMIDLSKTINKRVLRWNQP